MITHTFPKITTEETPKNLGFNIIPWDASGPGMRDLVTTMITVAHIILGKLLRPNTRRLVTLKMVVFVGESPPQNLLKEFRFRNYAKLPTFLHVLGDQRSRSPKSSLPTVTGSITRPTLIGRFFSQLLRWLS